MLKNIGSADRLTRVLAAILLLILVLTSAVTGIVAIIFWVLAAVLLLTALFSFCPLYYLLKTSTNQKVKS